MTTEGQPDEIEPDPRESAFELPPLDGRPFADDATRHGRCCA